MKRTAVGGKFKTYVLHIGEGRLLEYPLNKRNYHKYPSSTAIKNSILKPEFCYIAQTSIDDLLEKTDIVWSGYIMQESYLILLNYFTVTKKQVEI